MPHEFETLDYRKSKGSDGELGAFDVFPASGLSVACVLGEDYARLLAAAPSLLLSLKNLVFITKIVLGHGHPADVVKSAEMIIAKAEGR